jgi:hypothetical protein
MHQTKALKPQLCVIDIYCKVANAKYYIDMFHIDIVGGHLRSKILEGGADDAND